MIPQKNLSSIETTCGETTCDWGPIRAVGVVTLAMMLILLGCGREAADTTTVSPPGPTGVHADSGSPSTAEHEAEASAQPGLEMPDGGISAEPAIEQPAASGGFEMPKDVVLPDADGASSTPSIEYGTWEQIESLARSSGRVTVVDLWSLACEPCLKEFPGLVRLHQTQGSKVQCMAVDLDFDGRESRPPEHYEQQVLDFLQSVGAEGFPMYISTTPSDDVFAANKLASIPAVMVFDADGEIAKVFVDAGESAGFTYEKDIVPLVTRLVE